MVACKLGRVDVVKFLIRMGASVDAVDNVLRRPSDFVDVCHFMHGEL